MSCLSCIHSAWHNPAQCVYCDKHIELDLLRLGYARCGDYVYEPGTDEIETEGYNLSLLIKNCESIEIEYKT